jgi:hypothetical protein
MIQPRERRHEARVQLRDSARPPRLHLRPGGTVWLLDLSHRGAGVLTLAPLRPASMVALGLRQTPRAVLPVMVNAEVVSCRVESIVSGRVRYRSGLAFAEPSHLLRELASHYGYEVPSD